MSARIRIIVPLVLALSLGVARSATVTWTNVNGGNWSAAANWSPNQTPTASDNAVINTAGSYAVTLDINATIGSLALGASSGTQTLNITANSLVLTLNNASTINTNGVLAMSSSTLSGGGLLTINGLLNWSGGTIGGTGGLMVATNGMLNLVGNSGVLLQVPLTNAGSTNWSNTVGWSIYNNNGQPYTGAIYNLAGGVFNIESDQSLGGGYGNEYFINTGTVIKGANTATTTIGITFTNSATVTANEGTINFNHGGDMDGTFNAASGATINFNVGAFFYVNPPTLNGPGAIRFAGGTLTLASNTIPNLQLAGGTVTLGPAFQGGTITNLTTSGSLINGSNTVTGVFNCGNGVAGGLTVVNGAVLNWSGGTVTGALDLQGGAICNWSTGTAAAAVMVETAGVLNLVGNNGVLLQAPLTNAGTINWSNSVGWSIYNNNGQPYTGAIYNLAGALLNIESDQSLSGGYGNEFFNQHGNGDQGSQHRHNYHWDHLYQQRDGDGE